MSEWDAFPTAQAPASSGWDAFPAAPQGSSSFTGMLKSLGTGAVHTLANYARGTQLGEEQQFGGTPLPPVPTGDAATQAFGLHQPTGLGERVASSVGGAVADPASYIGPGGLPLKVAGAVLSGAGGQIGEEVGGTPGRIGGSLLGGVTAAKTLGPKQAIAAIPTQEELKAAAKGGYTDALNSGLELKPDALKNFGTTVEQDLIGQGYAPELAGKTFKVLDTIQNPPAGSAVTAANLDGLRKYLGRIAQETQPANGGMVKPTADAAAASTVLDRLKGFTESPPSGSVVAGDADAFAKTIKEANANYAASQRAALVNDKIVKAELRSAAANSGQNVANTIRQRMVDILANPKLQRGFSADELEQMGRVVRGTALGNTTRYIGNLMGGGGGMGSAVAAAMGATATGSPVGALAPVFGYGLRKASQASTMRNVSALEEMLRKRSPLYQSRLNALPTTNMAPNQGQIVRGLLGPLTQ